MAVFGFKCMQASILVKCNFLNSHGHHAQGEAVANCCATMLVRKRTDFTTEVLLRKHRKEKKKCCFLLRLKRK